MNVLDMWQFPLGETQAEQILAALQAAYPATKTTAELRQHTKVENVTGRIHDLAAVGWQVETVTQQSDRDGTAEYRLASLTRGEERVIDYSLEILKDNRKGKVIRLRSQKESRCSEASLSRLLEAVQDAVDRWEWEESHHAVPTHQSPTRGQENDLLDDWLEPE